MSMRGKKWLIAGVVPFLMYFVVATPAAHSPILGSSEAMRTETMLNKEAERLRAVPREPGRFKAGWARRSITPPLNTPTYGYSARLARGVEKILDSVFVCAMVIQSGEGPRVVFLTADICTWVPMLSDSIQAALSEKLPGAFLYPGTTHTHSGPGGYAQGVADGLLMGGVKPDICELIIENSIAAITEAAQSLQPASYRILDTHVPDLVMNRTANDPVDDEILLVDVKTETGERGAMVIFSAHATMIDDDLPVCSADYPGRLTDGLRKAGYSEAMFLSGATGQAAPRHEWQSTVRAVHVYGDSLLGALLPLTATDTAFHDEALLSTFSSPVYLPDYQYRLPIMALRPTIAEWLMGTKPEAMINGVQWGTCILVSHSFEFSSVISRTIKQRFRGAGWHVGITGFNGRNQLYVVPDAYYDVESYESSLTLFGPGLGSYLERITTQLVSFMSDSTRDVHQPFDLSQ